jgi:hypothetical protein
MVGRYGWRLTNRNGWLLQYGNDLTVAGEQSAPAAARVLLRFLLATADQPLLEFNDATTVWASLNRPGLVAAFTRPTRPFER